MHLLHRPSAGNSEQAPVLVEAAVAVLQQQQPADTGAAGTLHTLKAAQEHTPASPLPPPRLLQQPSMYSTRNAGSASGGSGVALSALQPIVLPRIRTGDHESRDAQQWAESGARSAGQRAGSAADAKGPPAGHGRAAQVTTVAATAMRPDVLLVPPVAIATQRSLPVVRHPMAGLPGLDALPADQVPATSSTLSQIGTLSLFSQASQGGTLSDIATPGAEASAETCTPYTPRGTSDPPAVLASQQALPAPAPVNGSPGAEDALLPSPGLPRPLSQAQQARRALSALGLRGLQPRDQLQVDQLPRSSSPAGAVAALSTLSAQDPPLPLAAGFGVGTARVDVEEDVEGENGREGRQNAEGMEGRQDGESLECQDEAHCSDKAAHNALLDSVMVMAHGVDGVAGANALNALNAPDSKFTTTMQEQNLQPVKSALQPLQQPSNSTLHPLHPLDSTLLPRQPINGMPQPLQPLDSTPQLPQPLPPLSSALQFLQQPSTSTLHPLQQPLNSMPQLLQPFDSTPQRLRPSSTPQPLQSELAELWRTFHVWANNWNAWTVVQSAYQTLLKDRPLSQAVIEILPVAWEWLHLLVLLPLASVIFLQHLLCSFLAGAAGTLRAAWRFGSGEEWRGNLAADQQLSCEAAGGAAGAMHMAMGGEESGGAPAALGTGARGTRGVGTSSTRPRLALPGFSDALSFETPDRRGTNGAMVSGSKRQRLYVAQEQEAVQLRLQLGRLAGELARRQGEARLLRQAAEAGEEAARKLRERHQQQLDALQRCVVQQGTELLELRQELAAAKAGASRQRP